jgi:hypothetical protein
MKIEKISKIKGARQDGAICNGFFFSFDYKGECTVYQMKRLECEKEGEAEVFAEFVLDRSDIIVPHSNSVAFGNEFFDEQDEFPLLYTNIYNNYANAGDKLKGVCLVYRIERNEREFTSTLVQIIEIGFVEDENLWKSAGEKDDVRPYGNFTIDAEQGIFYAFTMRDNTHSTRYFSFDLPKVTQGEFCEQNNIKRAVLNTSDIRDYFDCDYHHYVQGACCHNGKIYSLEGFTDSTENPPVIRIIDTKLKKEIIFKKFSEFGTNIEPEMIDFKDDICYYTDHNGNMYKLFF